MAARSEALARRAPPSRHGQNRALLAEDVVAHDDAALADHVDRVMAHFLARAPVHFAETTGQSAAIGALFEAAIRWDLDRRELLLGLAGASAATSSAEILLDRMAEGLRGAPADEPKDLAAVRDLGGDAAAALDELLEDYAWRAFHSDLAVATLAERPDAIVQAIRVARAGRTARFRPDEAALAAMRASVHESEQARFDDLFEVARAAYGANDDNTTVLYSVPLGLVRRAVLEVGRRLTERGRLLAVADALEATRADLRAVLAGGGPPAEELAARSDERHRAARLTPPTVIGEPLPPPTDPPDLPPSTRRLQAMLDTYQSVAWARGAKPDRASATVGTAAVQGRAVVATDPAEALVRMEPGDVLVAATTTAPYNIIFPVAAAVAVEHGGIMGHAAVLARELGLTAVIGVPGLLARVRDGDQVEVDPVAGTVTVLGRAT